MKTSHGRSTVSTLLSIFFALTFICHGVSALAQKKGRPYGEKTAFIVSKIDAAVVKEFQEAWHFSFNGADGFEGLVLLYPTHDGSILARSQGRSREQAQFTFGWAYNIIGVVHTHPNGHDPKPSGQDRRLADRFRVPLFTITRRGMYVYDPDTRKHSVVQDGLDWLHLSKWDQYKLVVAQKPSPTQVP